MPNIIVSDRDTKFLRHF
jgi:hypothetical protein